MLDIVLRKREPVRWRKHERFLRAHVHRLCLAVLPELLLAFLFAPGARAGKAAKVNGVIFTLGTDQVQTVWPKARVTLKNLTTRTAASTISNDLGEYTFTGVLPGDYEVTVTLAGFQTAAKRVTLRADGTAQVDFQLVPKGQTETVKVTAETTGVDLSTSSSASPTLTATILKSAVRLSDDFQEALPLLPGVVRGPDGLINVKGGRSNQINALVNTVSVADPFTGQPALHLPTVAVESMRVLSNPFSAEYGRFDSGVVEVNTRGGTDEWKWLFEDPVPRFRWINYRTHGVESASPHVTFAGPVKRDKLYVFQSISYGYDTVRVPSLPNPDNVRVEEKLNTHTQLDWDITPTQRLTGMFTADPQNTDFATINTFNPQPVTADYRQRGFFSSATDRWILSNGGFLQSVFSAKRLDSRIFPANMLAGEMILFPEKNSGTFFERQDRHTWLYQWSQSLHVRPLEWVGRHLVTVGYSYARATYGGGFANLPVMVLREDGTLSSRITYGPSLSSTATKNDLAFFLQDSWQIHPRLVLDLGLRTDSDSLSAETSDVAPRIGFVYAPTRDNRTAIRGGFGVFFDKIPLNVALFRDFPAQTITRYAADGRTIVDGPKLFSHVVATNDGRLRVPHSLGSTLQFDRELRRGLLFRFGYEHRDVFREFYVDPFEPAAGSAELRLFNSGRQTYQEFLWMLRWHPVERTTVFASYVRSSARGELNDYNQFFGNYSYALIRVNQRDRLPYDAPNRVLFWGIIGLPRKLEFVPVLDVHTGFPFSRLDADWNFIGRRNEAGRLPPFVGLDGELQYPFDFKFRGRRFKFRAGLKVANVLNHFNPRDVQQSVNSPYFGGFYNSVGRLFFIDGGFDF
jgi:hypothetical protein